MDNREKLEKMDRALRLLQDLRQSQVAMVEKSSKLQMDAMEFNFSEMEKNMGDLFTIFNESLDKIDTELERFEIKRNQFEMKHGLDKEEE
jgi:type II secretory pathway predicted ATPase ExeA